MSSGVADLAFKSGAAKPKDVRSSNIVAAKLVSDAIRTILGPFGMDKMIVQAEGDITTTNDGATIMAKMELQHPVAKMLVDVAQSQDVEAGDGTTTVVVLAGALLDACQALLSLGMHPNVISRALTMAKHQAWKILYDLSAPVDMTDRTLLIQLIKTSLSSKVVAGESDHLAPLVVEAALGVLPPPSSAAPPASAAAGTSKPGPTTSGKTRSQGDAGLFGALDLSQIQMVKKLGGAVRDTTIIDGLILWDRPTEASAKRIAGPTLVENARVGLIQFQLSPPKPDVCFLQLCAGLLTPSRSPPTTQVGPQIPSSALTRRSEVASACFPPSIFSCVCVALPYSTSLCVLRGPTACWGGADYPSGPD